MRAPPLNGERLTVIISTLFALLILAAGVTAQQQHTAPRDILNQLESDLRFQLKTTLRHDLAMQRERLALLDQTLIAWQESPQTEKNRKLLADWLLESTLRSMPGATEDLPEIPSFRALVKKSTEPPTVKPQNDLPSSESIQPREILSNPEQPELPQNLPEPSELNPVDFPNTNLVPQHVPSVVKNSARPVRVTSKPASFTSTTTPWVVPALASIPSKEKAVQINLSELEARITGYHVGLDETETVLLTLEEIDIEVLSKIIKQLEETARDFRFVKLYYDALTESERKNLTLPRSMQPTINEIKRQLTRVELSQEEDFLSDFEDNQDQQSEQLRKRLAALSDLISV